MYTSLQLEFQHIVGQYSTNQNLIQSYWFEIKKQYETTGRYYHNLTHLKNILEELNEIRAEINDWEAILFSVFYHDIIYDARAQDNEEQSAQLAKERLTILQLPESKIDLIFNQIVATKQHQKSTNSDTNYFLDADLSILGEDWEQYKSYYQNIRKEYAIYPDGVYSQGRKKALTHFLTFETIFNTHYFKSKYENQARLNIAREINVL
ncbi:putative metal-dependent HD superfamily phosphohydrolase [Myroides gitamensis]|uniref:HD domain-containing protein n=1 Tax=Myroides odoratus TaxID=256 RepID=UPI002169A627|nr:hypothetical protein [Myroides odoratus]MCS4239058.1 putative metal-dependent HD superfamily phosphohydrolase [Myroides odoratus]MDH6599683.1 putative metal-dependent HD superfamily phosphohydrolase [Myroides gitamensis]